jgi:hypothetical protein
MPQNHRGGSQVSATFNDHYSSHAAQYAAHRPSYPAELFEFLAAAAPARRLAWDCATGNGQAALALAGHFERVIATDASVEQLAQAPAHERITYRCEAAERASLEAASCDLVTVAQAVHWFAGEPFFAAVRRVACRGALVAFWTYGLMRVDAAVDRLIDGFNERRVGAFWPPERHLVDERYATLEFPFARIATPAWEMELEWSADEALAYLGTWSSVRRFAAAEGRDPVADLEPQLRAAWGRGRRTVRWPLTVLAGRPI